jgi:hypothetical protein
MNGQPMTHEQAVDLAPLFVLGALEEAEMTSVREHLATCPESHAEFEELGGVVPYLLDDPDLELVEPPAALRDRIMAAAAADLAQRAGSAAGPATATAPPAAPTAFPSASEREARAERTRARTSPLDWALRIAAVIAIVAIGAWNLQLQGQVNGLRDEVGAANAYRLAVGAVLDVADEPGSQVAVLEEQAPGGPRGIAAVAPNGEIQFALQDLPPTSGTQVYEAWAIVGENAPVPLGSFAVGSSGTASFTSRPGPTDAGVIVALSREPAAGATAPTEVVSIGIAAAPSS